MYRTDTPNFRRSLDLSTMYGTSHIDDDDCSSMAISSLNGWMKRTIHQITIIAKERHESKNGHKDATCQQNG